MLNLKKLARWRWEAALAACILVSLGVLAMSENGHSRLSSGYDDAMRSTLVTTRIAELTARLIDAETGQRGYLLTRREGYLAPYKDALPRIAALQADIRDYYTRLGDPQSLAAFDQVVTLIGAKLGELEQTLVIARQGRSIRALEMMATNKGRERMDAIRNGLYELQLAERERTVALVEDWRSSLQLSRIGIAAITALNIVLLVLITRSMRLAWERSVEREQELDRLVGERTEQLASLASYLQEMSEAEKTRLGRDLHDDLGAILTAAKMDVSWVRGKLSPGQDALGDKLDRTMRNIDQGTQAMRRIIEDLRPTTLASFGLMTAARELAEQAAERAGWKLKLELPDSDPDLPEDMEISLFRILQEALNNASKYAKATALRVSLTCDDGDCRLEIEDNGAGFRTRDVRPKANGLTGMRQRLEPLGGRFDLRSEPGRGTLIRAIIPIR